MQYLFLKIYLLYILNATVVGDLNLAWHEPFVTPCIVELQAKGAALSLHVYSSGAAILDVGIGCYFPMSHR